MVQPSPDESLHGPQEHSQTASNAVRDCDPPLRLQLCLLRLPLEPVPPGWPLLVPSPPPLSYALPWLTLTCSGALRSGVTLSKNSRSSLCSSAARHSLPELWSHRARYAVCLSVCLSPPNE